MKNKIFSNLAYLCCSGLGLMNFILFAFPYAASYYSYDLGQWGGKSSSSVGISGYGVMRLWSGGFGGFMSALVQLTLFLLGLAMLGYGAYCFLKAIGVIKPDILPATLCKKAYAELAVYAYAALNILLLVFLIILCASNSESESDYGFTASAGIRLSAGIFITLIFGVGAAVVQKILPAKLGASENNTPSVSYTCSQCGKKAKKGVKFCPECGGKVEETVDSQPKTE